MQTSNEVKMKVSEGQKVEVYDEGRKRWFKGKILHVERLDDNNQPDAWAVELTNGNRGSFDKEHVRHRSAHANSK